MLTSPLRAYCTSRCCTETLCNTWSMAATATEWLEVRSPYSGEVVGRAPKSGAEETRAAVDAAARALAVPLPAHMRADILAEDDRVKLITFSGSGDVGWGLQERAPRKRVKLELGNSTPVIVAADAAIEEAAAKLAGNAFSFAGQSCISVQRIYVERSAYDAFLERFLPRVEALRVGDPADAETDVGPVIDEDARQRILDWIGRSGGEVLAGG